MQILGISQIGRQSKITDRSIFQIGSSEIGILHDRVSHDGLSQVSSTEISSTQTVGIRQINLEFL
jgi:hypothetical protein